MYNELKQEKFAYGIMEETHLSGTVYGYIRVSTKEQNEDRQRIAMEEAGVPERNVYKDKQSGKDFNRPQYRKLLRKLKKDDLLYIKSIDRLGRNYEEILQQWRYLTKDKGIDIVVLDMPLLDTRQGRDLMGTLISDIVLQLLSYVAQTEREMIHERQREGIDAARVRGVRFGRRPMARPEGSEECLLAYKNGEISAREAARRLHISHATFLKWAKESEPAKQN